MSLSHLFPLYMPFLFISTYFVYRVSKHMYRIYSSPLCSLPGPPSLTWFYGSISLVPEADAYRLFERWTKQWGHTFKYSSILNVNKLYTTDLIALNYILSSDIYVKSNILTRFSPAFSIHMSKGLLFVEGVRHRQLRKIMGLAFSYAQIRKFTDVFFNKSLELRDVWMSEISQSQRLDGKLEIDAFMWINKLALDTIGLAGFDYNFDSLHANDPGDQPNELLQAVRSLFTFNFFTPAFIFQLFFPLARLIPTKHSIATREAVTTIRRIGNNMIAQKKSVMLAHQSGPMGKHNLDGSDLLSLLIKSSLAVDLPPEEQMSDEEILSQIPSVLLAGHETSATTVTWTLFSLATKPVIQAKLRMEITQVPTVKPTMDELMSLPYLDAVLREALRLHAPVGFTERIATTTDYIPLQQSFFDVHGIERDRVRCGIPCTIHSPAHVSSIRVHKGDKIFIPIRAINRSRELWGIDSEEFKPERWVENHVPETVKSIPAVWSNMMSFLAGPHACIGYRIALLQMKSMLFTLVRDFEFELAISSEDIGRRNNIVGRPYVASDPGSGSQLPMLIHPCNVVV
ncbi:cytochrome P450 [Lentinula edodes]|nr:cytochrome P450 [Lentinula edodes]